MFANTPTPPYYAVIFSSVRTSEDAGYSDLSDQLVELVQNQEGFLGMESARNEIGITVSYWKDLESIRMWKENNLHKIAQQNGKKLWYKSFKVRICKVERDYEF